MPRTSFAYYPTETGAHVLVRVFAGPDEQHRAHCGSLTFRPGEWADFQERVTGPGHTIKARVEDPNAQA